MILNNFTQHLANRLQQPLPGLDAHLKMASLNRVQWHNTLYDTSFFRESAVLILLYPKENEIFTALIQRPVYIGVHSGQISFPGGKTEKIDKNCIDTAIRECFEEIGVLVEENDILGTLSELFVPPSKFKVTPVIAQLNDSPKFNLSEMEVERVIELKISDLFDDQRIQKVQMSVNEANFIVPAFVFGELVIWGATAMIISEFKDICKEIDF